MRGSRIWPAALIAAALLAGGCTKGTQADGGATSLPTEQPSPSASEATVSPEPQESPSPQPAEIEDGKHFVYAVKVKTKAGISMLTFDLAYFLTGDEATQAAKDHGDEYPPPNDYYIVNDNPKLRTVPISPSVKVRYIPDGNCCDLVPGNIDAWTEAVNETNPTDYAGKNAPWWITVQDGQIVKIEQQYLP